MSSASETVAKLKEALEKVRDVLGKAVPTLDGVKAFQIATEALASLSEAGDAVEPRHLTLDEQRSMEEASRLSGEFVGTLLDNPPPPNDALKSLMRRGRAMLTDQEGGGSSEPAAAGHDATTPQQPSPAAGAVAAEVGQQVRKVKGYPYPGEIRAVFTTRAGLVRYAVEATGEDYRGMLHIFAADQIAAAAAPSWSPAIDR